MSGIANIDEFAAPMIRKKAGPFQADPFVVATRHYNALEAERLQGNGAESRCGKSIHGLFNIARSHQQRTFNGMPITLGPMGNRSTAQAMSNQHHLGQIVTLQCCFNCIQPVLAVRSIPFFLLDALGIWQSFFEIGLPMFGARVPQAGDNEVMGHW